MFKKPSLMLRIAIGKAVGLAFGLIAFFTLPLALPDADLLLRWGVLLWYGTLGGIVGLFGVFDRHPLLNMPLPWWVRGPVIGGWMNFVLVFFTYDTMARAMAHVSTKAFGDASVIASPFWLVGEGAMIGLLIAYVATRYGGEGKETVGR